MKKPVECIRSNTAESVRNKVDHRSTIFNSVDINLFLFGFFLFSFFDFSSSFSLEEISQGNTFWPVVCADHETMHSTHKYKNVQLHFRISVRAINFSFCSRNDAEEWVKYGKVRRFKGQNRLRFSALAMIIATWLSFGLFLRQYRKYVFQNEWKENCLLGSSVPAAVPAKSSRNLRNLNQVKHKTKQKELNGLQSPSVLS